MIEQEDRSESTNGPQKSLNVGATRLPLHLVFQACVGVIIGIGITSLFKHIDQAQLALAGVIVAVLAWIGDQGFKLPNKRSKAGKRTKLALRIVSLIGFTMAAAPLLALIEA